MTVGDFEVPAGWGGRRVLLQLDGVDSCCTVWVNGIAVGYSQDSRSTGFRNLEP